MEIVRLLYNYGARVSQADENNNTALHWATACSHRKCATVLLNYSSSIEVTNANGNTPLMETTAGSSVEMVRFFLERGASCGSELKSEE